VSYLERKLYMPQPLMQNNVMILSAVRVILSVTFYPIMHQK
jgi:hypothetical protein